MSAIIRVENLSKKYTIRHEQPERYVALRDVLAQNAKKLFSFPKHLSAASAKRDHEDFWALKDLNFEINQGDRVGIIGRNGAGKSTLLKILSRITEPSTGRITLNGRVASLLEVGTGFHPELTGRENIFLNGAILGMSRAEIRKKFDEIVDFSGVEKFLDTPVKRYSSGMYVRLAFAVAAHLEPEILVVDEVLAVGDAEFQKKCLGKMEDVSTREGRTVLFVSHNMGVISSLCSNTIYLNKGQIVQFDQTSTVLTTYNSSIISDNSEYVSKEKTKEHGINKIYVKSEQGGAISYHNKDLFLHIEVNDTESIVHGLNIGIAILDKWKRKVFTTYTHIIPKKNSYVLIIPSNPLLSGSYSFDAAIFVPNGILIEYLKDVCPIEVVDYSSNLSLFGDADVGVVHINTIWQ